jgi:nucleoside-diphosphate-sugar epimerase
MGKKTYALTGVTGLLGRNVFFEIIKDNLKNLNNIEFVILGRSSTKESLKNRIENIFFGEGINYLSVDIKNHLEFDEFFESNITYVEINLSSSKIISETEREKLVGKSISNFLHIAASTEFGDDPIVIETLNQQNVTGTAQILALCKGLNIEEFCYVSSAYACGKTYGDVSPDYTNLNQPFRNHYEKTKLQGEILVKEYQEITGVRCRIFRPSIIVGKLIENVKGEICKFDTVYGWAFFFLKWKVKNQPDGIDSIYDKKVDVELRIALNSATGLNLVPVDFAAKMLYQVCKQDLKGDYFHLVNNQETNSALALRKIFELFNISGYKLVETVPENLNPLESFYYKTIGNIFTPYVTQKEIRFNTDNLKEIYTEQNLHCPEVNENNLQVLLEFAKSKNFGLSMVKELSR